MSSEPSKSSNDAERSPVSRERIWWFVRHLREKRKWFFRSVIGVILVSAVGAGAAAWCVGNGWDRFDAAATVLGLATLVVALGIGALNTYQAWVESLPWVICLRVKILDPDSNGMITQLVFQDMPLAAPANAREWSQNLMGKALTPSRSLPLDLFTVDLSGMVVDRGRARRMCITYGMANTSESNGEVTPIAGFEWPALLTVGGATRVIVFAAGKQEKDEAVAAGAYEVGADRLIRRVQRGWTDFDAVVATSELEAKVNALSKVLGDRGLMPSKDAGTLTTNVGKAVEELKGDKRLRLQRNAHVYSPEDLDGAWLQLTAGKDSVSRGS